MIDKTIKEKILKEKRADFISEINYKDKKYVKAITEEKGIPKYVYYEIEGEEIKEIEDKDLINYFKRNFEIQERGIIY